MRRNILGEHLAPLLQLGEKSGVDLRGSALGLTKCPETVERTAQHGLAREQAFELAPAVGVFRIRKPQNSGARRAIRFSRSEPAVIDEQFGEVRQNAQRQLRGPRIASELKGGCSIAP